MSEPLDPHNIIPKIGAGTVRVLRQSTLGSGDICLQRMGYDVDPDVQKGNGEARIVGTAYHAGLQAFYDARIDGEVLPYGAVSAAAQKVFSDEVDRFPNAVWATDIAQARLRVDSMLEAYLGPDGGVWPAEYEVVGTEQEWFLPLCPGWVIKGSIDLVLLGPNGVVLDDHKTAGKPWQKTKHDPRKHVQPPTYWWAWWTLFGKPPAAFTYSIMTYAGKFERRWLVVSEAQIAALLRKAVAMTSVLDSVPLNNLPTNPSSNLCSELYCDYWHRCPAGAMATADSL